MRPESRSDEDATPVQVAEKYAGYVIIGLLVVVRFWGLTAAPSGFWLDEAAVASQSMCVAETGRTAQGEIRIFAPLDAGFITPVTLGVSALWVRVAGDSITSFRMLASIAGLAGLGAIAWAAYILRGRRLNWTLSGALVLTSPWIFHLSRVYWDPIFAFALLAGCIAAWATWRENSNSRYAFLAGLAGGLAMVTYPPLLVSVPLTLLVLFAGGWRKPKTRRSFMWVAIGLVSGLLPLVTTLRDSSFGARQDELAVWGSLNRRRMGWSLADIPRVVVENLARHLNPKSLFFDGDANLRHGSGYGGVLSLVEAVALVAAVLVVLSRSKALPGRLLFLVPIGFLPAALTWEAGANGSLPHYLRSIGAAVPLLLLIVLGSEAVVDRFRFRSIGSWLACGLVVATFAPFVHDYFTRYSAESRLWFERIPIEIWRDSGDWIRPDQPLAQQYFEMSEGGRSCRSFQHEGVNPVE